MISGFSIATTSGFTIISQPFSVLGWSVGSLQQSFPLALADESYMNRANSSILN